MKSDMNLIRAIGSEFVLRKFKSLLVPFVIAVTILLGVVIYLATLNAWWLIIALPIGLLTIVGSIVLVGIYMLMSAIRPQLSKTQKGQVSDFVDKMERVAEHVQTPLPVIIFRIVIDSIRKPQKTFIHAMAEDSTTLHSDYLQLRRNFSI
jgi:flagellar biosynthesis protein FlhB